jgi:hypothetical protein
MSGRGGSVLSALVAAAGGLASLVACASLLACASETAPNGAAEPSQNAIAAVHASRCGACHRAPDPKTRTREHLVDAFSRHKRRVHLTREEWAEMVDYLAMPEGQTARQP